MNVRKVQFAIFIQNFVQNDGLTSLTVKRLIQNFREIGSIKDLKQSGHSSISLSTQNIEAVLESIAESVSRTSIPHRGQELDISRSSLQHIPKKDLHLHAHQEVSHHSGSEVY